MRTPEKRDNGPDAPDAMKAFVLAIANLVDAQVSPLREEIRTLRAEVLSLRQERNKKVGLKQ